MGAGASTQSVGDWVDDIGSAYEPHAEKVRELGVDGTLLEELVEEEDIQEALDSIGVTNKLQRKRLMREIRDYQSKHGSPHPAEPSATPSASPGRAVASRTTTASQNASPGRGPSSSSTSNAAASSPAQPPNYRPARPLNVITSAGAAAAIPVVAQAVPVEFMDPVAARPSIPRQPPSHIAHTRGLAVQPRPPPGRPGAARVVGGNTRLGQSPTARPPGALGNQVPRSPMPSPLAGGRLTPTMRSPAASSGGRPVPEGLCLRGRILFGLGWDPPENEDGVVDDPNSEDHMDLDVGIVLFGKGNIYHDFVYFHNQSCIGVQHSGDNRTGAGDGDDEQIRINLSSVEATVESMVFVISCYTGDFLTVKEAFVRVEDEGTHQELGHYTLSGLFDNTSLIVCKLVRHPMRPGEWVMQIIGEPIGGRSIIDFFHQDLDGPMAALRREFKVKARVVYDDNRFFEECASRAQKGYAVATSVKD